jgi:iron complex transport system ATP-binding protein
MSLVVATDLSLPGRLRRTSLALEAGTLTCLIGPNGSGKTSLLHALAGIGRPGGRTLIGGIDPSLFGPGARQTLLTYLPASRDVPWPLGARDLIALGGADESAIDEILGSLELEELAARRVDQLSTGERTRILIARALVPRPKLLLLDEPAANLDPLWQLKAMDFIRDSASDHAQAALVAMHDLELARAYADRLIVMQDCAVAADAAPAGLFEGPIIPAIFGIRKSGGGWRPIA